MLIGRFFLIIPALAIAGSLARKQTGSRRRSGTFPTDTPAVRRPAARRGPHRRRPDVLPRPRARPHRRAARHLRRSHRHDVSTPTVGPGETRPDRVRASTSMFDPAILRRAVGDSFVKLNPRTSWRNPVMFVVEVGSVLTTILFFTDLGSRDADENVFAGARRRVPLVHRAVRELRRGHRRGARQGAGRHAAQDPLRDRRRAGDAPTARSRRSRAPQLDLGDECVVVAGEVIPGDGEVVEGIASVDESAITGESAPVIRESGGDRSAVTGGTRVLSDRIVVRISARPGETFIDRMIALVEGVRAAEDAERDRAEHPAGRAHDHLPARDRHAPAVRDLLGRRADRGRPRRAARVPDPDDHRWPALRDRHRRHGPSGAAQRARDERPGGRGGRRREHAAARQDRHHHLRRPPGRRVPARRPASPSRSSPTPRCCRASPTRRPRVVRSSSSRASATGCASATSRDAELVPVHRPDPHERARLSTGRSVRKGAADSVRRWVEEQGGTVPTELRTQVERSPAQAARRSSSPTERRPPLAVLGVIT